MSNYIDNFIESLGVSGDVKELAEVLFKEENDCNDFYIGYYGKNRYVIFDLLDYRKSKLPIHHMSVDSFVELCNNKGVKEAFENTFLQHFDNYIIELIDEMIGKELTSLEYIYNSFMENPNENILKYVL